MKQAALHRKGKILKEPINEATTGPSECTRYFIDPVRYAATGEEVKLSEKEAEEMKRNTEEAMARTATMRAEITTSAQLRAMGGTKAVAKHYRIGESTAAKHLVFLNHKERHEGEGADLQGAPNEGQPGGAAPEPQPEPEAEELVQDAPTLAEIEQFHTDAEPQPDLPRVIHFDQPLPWPNPVLEKKQPIDLAMELVARVTEEVTMKQIQQQKDLQEQVRRYFTKAIVAAEQKVRDSTLRSDQLMHQRDLELLTEIECGAITALNERGVG